tara:strand:- start:725 stop:2035 length:1311 start_codon:yes stop_codon:yes gene_type:complete
MFPQAPLFLNPKINYKQRRQFIMKQCTGPIVLVSPKEGPNQDYSWAHCYQPVYQDSYFLYLTGINQIGTAIILDPIHNKQMIFLPNFNSNRVFWDGYYFAYKDKNSHAFLKKQGFDSVLSMDDFYSVLHSFSPARTCWHLLLEKKGRRFQRTESYALKRHLSYYFKSDFNYTNIADVSWDQRFTHDQSDIDSIVIAAEKTTRAFNSTLSQSFTSEVSLAGTLIGQLLKETPYGLSFSPIIAKNENAAILHYSNNSSAFGQDDLVLMDFGLRWDAMCTDISRTIPVNGRFNDIQKRLMDIVIETQYDTIGLVKPGVSFADLNEFAWEKLDQLLEVNFKRKGGRVTRSYEKQPHNIGHLLGIQVHDGDSNRSYRKKPLEENCILTIEPGLYGTFEFNGHCIECGIRIEDNVLVTSSGVINLTADIPKSCHEIETAMRQ